MLRASSVLPDQDVVCHQNCPLILANLAPLPRWVAWQTEGRGPKGKPTKVPYAPDRRKAKADDPATWGDCEEAKIAAGNLPKPFGQGGIGLQLGDHDGHAVAGIDLDTCRDPAGGLKPWAIEVMARFTTYAEISPSGTGVKLFFTYDPADAVAIRKLMGTATGRKWATKGVGDHPPGIELYISGRFFAVTGQRYPDAPDDLRQMGVADIEWLIRVAVPMLLESGLVALPVAAAKAAPAALKQPSGDGSRSALAFKVAAKVKRGGGDFPAFLEALESNADTAAWKADKGEAAGGRELRRCWEKAAEAVDEEVLLTEHGVALEFTAQFKDRLRYCHHTGAWYVWSGTHWRRNETKLAFSWARRLVAHLNRTAEFKTKVATGKAAFSAAVERFAQADEAFAVTSEVWDRDLFLLGTPGGTVDLRTGLLRPSRQNDYITKLTAVAPAETPECPLWIRFLNEAMGNDQALIRYLRQWLGYCLSGDIREQSLTFCHGAGENGKGVCVNTAAGVMGAYARNAPMDTFTASHGDRHPTELAMLRGARMVTASETEEGRAWAEARIKTMTGGDTITARFMKKDFFEYLPQFKLTFMGNHKPVLKNVDHAAKRRFKMVPFGNKPPVKDVLLPDKLKPEWPAILRWMIDGCLDWQMNGLIVPPAIAGSTDQYFSEQDTLAHWMEDCCDVKPALADMSVVLWRSWQTYCLDRGDQPGGSKSFTQTLTKRGFLAIRNTHGIRGRGFAGLRLRMNDDTESVA